MLLHMLTMLKILVSQFEGQFVFEKVFVYTKKRAAVW